MGNDQALQTDISMGNNAGSFYSNKSFLKMTALEPRYHNGWAYMKRKEMYIVRYFLEHIIGNSIHCEHIDRHSTPPPPMDKCGLTHFVN